MSKFVDFCIDNYRTVFALLALISIVGIVSFINMPKESSPDVKLAIVYVSMRHDGISPEDAERMLIKPMERYLRTVEGVDEMTSSATLGHASVVLKFDAGFNSDIALNDVRAQVDLAKAELPDETDEPIVQEVDFSLFPVINIMLSGEIPERTMIRIAKRMQDRIEEISSVLEAEIAGERDEVLEIIVDPINMQSYGITVSEVYNTVSSANKLIAAGELKSEKGSFSVKVPSLFTTPQDVLSLAIKAEGDAKVTIGDVAQVRKTFRDPDSFAKVNGKGALVISVKKRVGRNILETIEAVKKTVEAERLKYPDTLRVDYAQDESQNIKNMLSDLLNNLFLAVFLVFIITYLYVGFRTAILVAIAVPGSFLIGIAGLSLLGFTLNIVVLFSLILAVGMLVDAAIIVSEYADAKMAKGASPREAYSEATKRMFSAAFLSVATILIVFLPLLYWPGTVGQFMRYMPMTLMITLTASLIMAVYVIPSIGVYFSKKLPSEPEEKAEKKEGFSDRYASTLNTILNFPGKFIAAICALLVCVVIIFGMFGPGVEFFPKIEPSNAIVQIKARGNLSIYEKENLVGQVYEEIKKVGGIKTFYSQSFSSGQGKRDIDEDVIGQITMELADWQTRPKADDILTEIRELSAKIPGIVVETKKQEKGPPTGEPIFLQVSSNNPLLLNGVVEKLRAELAKVDGLKDLKDSRPLRDIEWKIDVDSSEAVKFGTSISEIGTLIQFITNGAKVGTYRPLEADDEIDILVRYPENKRTLEEMDNIFVNTPIGHVPISSFVTRTPQPKVGVVQRAEGYRVIDIKADVQPGVLASDKIAEISYGLNQLRDAGAIPDDVRVTFKGEQEDQDEAGSFLAGAFGLALAAMFIMLLIQFNSIFAVIVIMSAVFLATIGVFLALFIVGMPFSIVMSGVGTIALGGIIISNNVIFIDTFRELKEQGEATREALIETGRQRLRPILLTAITTVVGLIPMMLNLTINFIDRSVSIGAPSSQWWTQLSISIGGGLTFGTVLTLFFTPAVILLAERWGLQIYKKKAA